MNAAWNTIVAVHQKLTVERSMSDQHLTIVASREVERKIDANQWTGHAQLSEAKWSAVSTNIVKKSVEWPTAEEISYVKTKTGDPAKGEWTNVEVPSKIDEMKTEMKSAEAMNAGMKRKDPSYVSGTNAKKKDVKRSVSLTDAKMNAFNNAEQVKNASVDRFRKEEKKIAKKTDRFELTNAGTK